MKTDSGPATKVTYAADWSEYFGHQPAGRQRRRLFPSRSAVGVGRHRCDRHRPLLAARGLARWRRARRRARRRTLDLRPRLSEIQHRGRRRLRLVLRQRCRPREPDAHADHRRPRQALGVPLQGSQELVAQSSIFNRPGGVGEPRRRPPGCRRSKPVWLMEMRLPGGRQGREPAQRVRRSEERGERAAVFLRRTPRRSHAAALSAGADRGARSRSSRRACRGSIPLPRVYGGRMVDTGRIHVYAWDARPFPAFPDDTATWGDGANWRLGHWLNGRLAAAPLVGSRRHAARRSRLCRLRHAAARRRRRAATRSIASCPRAKRCSRSNSPTSSIRWKAKARSCSVIAARAVPTAILDEDDLVAEKRAAAPADADARTGKRAADHGQARLRQRGRRLPAGDCGSAATGGGQRSRGAGRSRDRDDAGPGRRRSPRRGSTRRGWRARRRASRCRRACSRLEPGDTVAVAQRRARARVPHHRDRRARRARGRGAGDRRSAIYRPTVGGPRKTRACAGADRRPAARRVPRPAAAARRRDRRRPAMSRRPRRRGPAASRSTARRRRRASSSPPSPPRRRRPACCSMRSRAGPAGRIDKAPRVRVKLDRGELASASRLAMLAGGEHRGACAMRRRMGSPAVRDGDAGRALEPTSCRAFCADRPAPKPRWPTRMPAGARFVVLDAAVTRGRSFGRRRSACRSTGVTDQRTAISARRASPQRCIASAALGRRPLSPVHVSGKRSGGDLTLSPGSGARALGGDAWDGVEVPLGEDSERYEIDVLDGATVVRTHRERYPQAVYTASPADRRLRRAAERGQRARASDQRRVGRGSPAAATV